MANDNHAAQIVNFACGPQPAEGCIDIDGSRIVLPDLRILADAYVSNKLNADDFIAQTHLVPKPRSIGLMLGYRQHKWMYDAASFMIVLRRLGFSNIEESSFGKSRMPALEKLDL